MYHDIRSHVPSPLNRYLLIAHLSQLQPGMRFDLDADTYILRQGDRYVTYRTWMTVLPLVEVFRPGEEHSLVRWLEQFGYSFELGAPK